MRWKITAYYPSGGYFNDFVLVTKTRSSGRDAAPSGDAEGNHFTSPPERASVLFFSGLAVVHDELVVSAERFKATAFVNESTSFVSYAGSYTAVIHSENDIFITNDIFGLCSLFYYQDADHVFVSNRIHLISKLLVKYNKPRRPNVDVIYTSLASNHLLFMHPYSHETVVTGLNICPVDSILHLNERRELKMVPKAEHYPHSGLPPHPQKSDYPALIECAADEIKRNVVAVFTSSAFSRRVVDLSGGKDSRLVFGAVEASHLLSSSMVRVSNKPSIGDLETGVGIAHSFNAQFDSGDRHERYSKSSLFVVGFWRSMISGMRHEVGASNRPTLWQRGTVRLNGGCGELYRDFWAKKGLLNAITDIDRFAGLCRPGLPRDTCAQAHDSLWRAIGSMPGDTTPEKLRNHYMFFRSRFHFGIPAYNEWAGYLQFSVLQSPALLLASRLLDPSDCMRGRTLFDVMEHILPELNRMPYGDGSSWPEDFVSRSAAAISIHRKLPPFAGEVQQAYEDAENTRVRFSQKLARKVDNLEGAESIQQTLRRISTDVVSVIRDSDRLLAQTFDDSFMEWFSDLWREQPDRASTTASKILAIYDLCFDTETTSLDNSGLPYHERYSDTGYSEVKSFFV